MAAMSRTTRAMTSLKNGDEFSNGLVQLTIIANEVRHARLNGTMLQQRRPRGTGLKTVDQHDEAQNALQKPERKHGAGLVNCRPDLDDQLS